MMRWVADNSETYSLWKTEVPDILLLGGLIGDEQTLLALQENLIGIKRGLSMDGTHPLKWNFKDLKSHYLNAGLAAEYGRLLHILPVSTEKEATVFIQNGARARLELGS